MSGVFGKVRRLNAEALNRWSLQSNGGCEVRRQVSWLADVRRASRSFLTLLFPRFSPRNATPARTLLGHLFPDNTNSSFRQAQFSTTLPAQSTVLGTRGTFPATSLSTTCVIRATGRE
jgi:hypothetical protein